MTHTAPSGRIDTITTLHMMKAMSKTTLSTFHAFNFTRDSDGETELVLRNIQDGDLSWTGTLGNDDVVEAIKCATAGMLRDGLTKAHTAYGTLEAVE